VTRTARYVAVASAAVVAYFALGYYVSTRSPTAFDGAFAGTYGVARSLAWVLTSSGFFPTLAAVAIVALTVGFRLPAWRSRAFFAVGLNLIGWFVSDALKFLFHRPRPSHWLYRHETSYGYSSGHSTDAIIVYGLWAIFIFRSPLPKAVRMTTGVALVVWALGVSWSRLSLGVHYATDVLGGWLLGIALLAIGFALFPGVVDMTVERFARVARFGRKGSRRA